MTSLELRHYSNRQVESVHDQAVIAAAQRGFEDGVAAEKSRMARALDLIAA